MNRVVSARLASGEDLLFRAMQGHESLSSLFEFDVELLSKSVSLDMRGMLGQWLTLDIEQSGGAKRHLNGQVTRATMAGRDGSTERHYVYRLTVRPWLWYLTQTSDSKIFQQKSVPDVLREVLAEYPYPVEYKLTASYRNWEYCVQYQESDFAFVSRLMEHEGIYYWFKHEGDKHTLVITDDTMQHDPLPGSETIAYYAPDNFGSPLEEFLAGWEPVEEITPGGFATVDYDFRKPAASLDARRENPGPYEGGNLEVYEWMGGYTEADQGEQYSRVRLEALQARQAQVYGHGNVRGLAPGYLFTLRNHPRQAENREYLIVGVRYRIQESGYASDARQGLFDVQLSALPSSTQFRAPRQTPLPYTHGPQTARVVGKPGEEIWTDEYGRIKVHFHWDRYGQRNENSSCWVRVSSPWAGSGFGGIQLPRVGDEVIVDFIGGQPDRPIVVGRVYNAGNMPPWELPGNATQSGFLSRTKQGNPATANALMFEDLEGSERIWLHAERDMVTEVEANENHTTDGWRNTLIGGSDTLRVEGLRTTTVVGHESEFFEAGADRTVTGEVNETVTGNENRKFTGDVVETITGNVEETITGNLTQTTTGDVTRTITGPVLDKNTGNVDETITGNLTQTTTGDVTRTITGPVVDTITGAVETTVTGDTTATNTGTITHTVTGQYDIHANTGMTVTTPAWKVVNTGTTEFWRASFMAGTPARLNIVGVSADLWGARAQGYGLNLQGGVAKLDFFYITNSNAKARMQNIGALITNTAAAVHTGGANIINKVISLFT
ncbi:VgrG protein [plant metagenome]|uniref:VgrG protein n=1 Tax=plant metagenome TaxID=1297885 RepID=A0A484QG18_9ZZZZ